MLSREAKCSVGEYLSPLGLPKKKRECGDYIVWWRDINDQASLPAFSSFFSQVKLKKKQNQHQKT